MQLLMWGFCCCSSLNTVKYLKVMQWVAIDSDQRWVISWWLQSVLWMETEMENSIKMTLSEQCQVMQPQGELFFCGVFPTSDHLVLPTALDGASLVAQRLKYLPAMQETWVRFLGWEDPLEKEMATHSSILAWRIPWTEKPGGLQSMGSQRVGHDRVTSLTYCFR